MRKTFFCRALFWFLPRCVVVGLAADVYEIRLQGVIGPPVSAFVQDSLKEAGAARARRSSYCSIRRAASTRP